MNVVSGHNSQEGLSELDSHADTTAAGSNMVMLDDPENLYTMLMYPHFLTIMSQLKASPLLGAQQLGPALNREKCVDLGI